MQGSDRGLDLGGVGRVGANSRSTLETEGTHFAKELDNTGRMGEKFRKKERAREARWVPLSLSWARVPLPLGPCPSPTEAAPAMRSAPSSRQLNRGPL